MSTEGHLGGSPVIYLEQFPSAEGLEAHLERQKEKSSAPVVIEARLEDFEKIRQSMLVLRAANISPLLLIQPPKGEVIGEELELVINYLRSWDQLYLQNILTLLGSLIPEKFRKSLEMESKLELKWFQEWMTANQDSRLSRYPGLPWRSFMRKVTSENFDFALTLLRVGTGANEMTLDNLVGAYLKAKKKAICFFPKKWGRLQ